MTDRETIDRSVQLLARSRIGRNAMRRVLAWLDDDGLSLDGQGQDAVQSLLAAAWGPYAGSTRDAMRAALESGPQGAK